jgi:hypothetical protein
MRIRRLARKAVFITAAVMVLIGFSAGIAGAASAAPASPAVTSSSAIHRMLPGCTPQPQFCTYASSIRGLLLLQKFGCEEHEQHTAQNGGNIFEMVNGCHTRVYYYYGPGNEDEGCINGNTSQSGVGRFPKVGVFLVGAAAKC